MSPIFLKLIEQLNSSIFVLLLVLICIGIFLYKTGVWSTTFRHHDEKITSISGLAEKVIVMGTKVDLIYQIVNPNKTVVARSPINLTDLGKQIAEILKANTIVEKHNSKLLKEVELESPKNAYDIQMASMKVAKGKLITLLTEEELTAVKQEAYNRGIIVEDVMAIFGVILRNLVLNQKGFPISDVDKHTPDS